MDVYVDYDCYVCGCECVLVGFVGFCVVVCDEDYVLCVVVVCDWDVECGWCGDVCGDVVDDFYWKVCCVECD